MELNGIHYDTYKIQRLYFRYIRETELERLGLSPEKLAVELAWHGLIWLSEDSKRYAELPLFMRYVHARDFKKLYEKPNGLLAEFYRGLRK